MPVWNIPPPREDRPGWQKALDWFFTNWIRAMLFLLAIGTMARAAGWLP